MYVRNIKFEGEFDGQKITASLSQLSFEDAMVIEAIDDSIEDSKKNVEAARILSKKLPSYVTEFNGPIDSEGNKVTIEEVCSTAYFAQLMVAIGKKLINASSPPQTPPAV
jgi:hypothetical protein